MRAGVLGLYILLLTLVVSVLTTVVQATEYREVNTIVNASDILNHIEKGNDVNLTNCHIFGELNLSKIKLEMVPNPLFNILLNRRHDDRKQLINHGINENLSVISSRIIIQNSTFENKLDLSNTQFNTSVDFDSATFNNSANFRAATFKAADFSGTTFNNSADFDSATFNSSAFFGGTTFNNAAYFEKATFKAAEFIGTNFSNSADFSGTTFNNFANFALAKFNDAAEFIGPTKPDKLLLDEMNFQIFYKYYNGHGRYDDADAVYYNYRQNDMKKEEWSSFGHWWNFLSWITCGFGIKPLNTLLFGGAVISLFSLIYTNPVRLKINKYSVIPINLFWNVHMMKRSDKIIPFELSLNNPAIVNFQDQNQKARLSDVIYYSIGCFTFMSHDNWCPRDNFKRWVAFEGVLGWFILGIFMATLAKTLIRV